MGLAKVILVEDEAFTRGMLTVTLSALGLEVVASCASAAEAVAEPRPFEVAILDLDLGPGPSGIDVAYALRERRPTVGLVFLTSFSDPRIKDPAERALPAGARFVVKSRLEDPSALRDLVLDARREPLRPRERPRDLGMLTTNQIDALRLLAAGRSNAEIAQEFGVTDKAVERTIQRALDSLGIDRSTGNPRVLAARAYAALSGKSMPSP